LGVARGGTGVTASTGSGSNVLSISPNLVTPVLGTPASGLLSSCTGLPLTTGVTGTLPVLNGGTGVTLSTGSGSNVLSISPNLVTPVLGTPASGLLSSCTGLPLTTGVTGVLPVANGGTGVTLSTGSGSNVLSISPTLVTPALGTPDSGVLTSCTGLPLTTGVTGVLPVDNGGTGYNADGASVFKFDTTPATTAANAGELSWNTVDGTLDLKLDNGVTLQVGQETNIKVYASTTITNGQVVYISGGTGSLPEVSLADYSTINAQKTLGIATQNITSGTYGYITLVGLVRDLNLITLLGSPISSGQSVWLGASGALTKTEPPYPFAKVRVGHIVNATDVTGSIHVNVHFEPTGTVNGTGKIGYSAGAGGTVTQATSKSTGVTLNKTCGQITTANSSLANDATVSFDLTNSRIEAGDVLILNHLSGGTVGSYLLNAQCGAGTATINIRNIITSNTTLSETLVIAFVVIRGSST
jgi:hypothetical protein